MEGDANGAPHPDPGAYAKKFTGKYSHRTIKGGIGHNLPQEAPQAFAEAVIELAELSRFLTSPLRGPKLALEVRGGGATSDHERENRTD